MPLLTIYVDINIIKICQRFPNIIPHPHRRAQPLERRGLIGIATNPTGRLSRLMTLTPAGQRLLANAVPLWQRTHQQIETLLPNKNPSRLRGNLRTLS